MLKWFLLLTLDVARCVTVVLCCCLGLLQLYGAWGDGCIVYIRGMGACGSLIRIIRPPVRSNGRSYVLPVMFSFFFSTPNLQAPSADRRQTLPHDRNLVQFYNASPKIRGFSPKKILGPKTCKISVDFIQPHTLIANVSGTPQYI